MHAILLSAGVAYWVAVAGVLLVYVELIRPGAILPGACGVLLLCWGARSLWSHSLRANGVMLCIAAAMLFTAEAMWATRWTAGALGSIALIAGSLLLCRDRIPAPLAVFGGAAVGLSSAVLAGMGRRARRNKMVEDDIGDHEPGTTAGC